MPRHTFKFNPVVVEAVRQYVRNAINSVGARRFNQESTYTAALLSRLQGVAYDGPGASVVFESTIFDDRGRGSAESRFGADLAITATISDGKTTIRKAILVQAKLGHLDDLPRSQIDLLKEQIGKMKRLVEAPKIMEIPEEAGVRYPRIISGNRVFHGEPYLPVDLPEYFTNRVTTTLDGCTDQRVVEAVQDSSLPRVHIIAKQN